MAEDAQPLTFSFAELAVEAGSAATREAHGLDALQNWRAREELVVAEKTIEHVRRTAGVERGASALQADDRAGGRDPSCA